MTVEKMIKFLEDFGGERQYYYALDNLYDDGVCWEIFFHKGERRNEKQQWSMRRKMKTYTKPDTFITSKAVMTSIFKEHLNMAMFEIQLLTNIQNMLGWNQIVINEAEKVFGEEFVDGCYKTTKEFGESLTQAVEGVMRKSKIKLLN